MVLSRRTYRRMDNIRNFCDFDTENGTATLHLYYQSVDEVLENRLSTVDKPVIAGGAIEQLEELLECVPKEFKVNFWISIRDYKGYNPGEIEKSDFSNNRVYP